MDERKLTIEKLNEQIALAKKQLENVHGTECEVYARIVGYYRAVKNWNKGKKEEYSMRSMFKADSAKDSAGKSISDNAVNSMEKITAPLSREKDEKVSVLTAAAQDKTKDSVNGGGSYYELFFRKTCPNCPAVESYMSDVNMSGRSIDVDTADGLSEAAKKGVFAAPTVIFYDASGQETDRCHTTEEIAGVINKAA